ncbi:MULTISPECIES: hypothetical protein [Burkholderia]|uniref:Uncharacterized protein n=1 Tax=Burkholderia anthinoferrum TaxID=3090833 RepID=A0ABU5WUZ2_9BURK|nr:MULTISPECIES: hypothetical protein [Burkholderia]MEB2504104.1 hypothetical protein [Burkholderia anthinoferrum]MEB2535501.1 hypothetical protein [Burkholderia anthinoferrum]MEB2563877.1 hypothetical protein [Burkholderia anthinoferrum]MEB2582832.1 hypothetical protein [Burkholderia anthinoferrum]MCA8106190.1 hypothetical protein [Burkholderia sp. AU36459]
MKSKSLFNSAIAGVVCLFQVGHAVAGTTCLLDSQTKQANLVGNSSSWSIPIQQATNTWQDWIWRGDTFLCNGVRNVAAPCTYTWTKTRSNGYTVSGSASLNPESIPIVGGILNLLHVDASYGRTVTNTESTGWSQQVPAGKYATFVEVVVRRWKQGVFQGAYQITSKRCTIDEIGDGHFAWGHVYSWNGSARYGNWTANQAVNGSNSAYGMVWIH